MPTPSEPKTVQSWISAYAEDCPMTEQRFSVILKGGEALTDDIVERLYSRCDDVTAGSYGGIGHVHFDRPADSLNEAIASALVDLRACGLEVERIEIDPQDILDAAAVTA